MIKKGHGPTDKWLANQAIWMDKDMFICGAFFFVLGFVFGVAIL